MGKDRELRSQDEDRRLRLEYSSALSFPLIFFLVLSVGLASFSMYHLQNGPKKALSRSGFHLLLVHATYFDIISQPLIQMVDESSLRLSPGQV
jgi:hypothetical protein